MDKGFVWTDGAGTFQKSRPRNSRESGSSSVHETFRGVPIEVVAAILGNSVKVVERHYSPWVQQRQDALEAAVKGNWDNSSAKLIHEA